MFTGGLTQHCLTQLAPAVPTAEDICVTTGFDRMRRSKLLHGAATDHLCLIASRCMCLCHTVATTVSGHCSELPSRSVLILTRVGLDAKCTWLLLFMLSSCDLILNWSGRTYLELQNIRRHENSLNGSRVTTVRQTRRGEARRRICATFGCKRVNNDHI